MNKVGSKVDSKNDSKNDLKKCVEDTELDTELDSSESKEDSVEVKGFSIKFKGMYTTTLIVLALIAMVWILQACTSTSTYTVNSTQIQNVDIGNSISSDVTTKVETKTKSVNQVKIL